MEELLSIYSVSDILMYGIFIGMLFNMIQDIITSLIDYLREKAWRVSDYEEIIYFYIDDKAIVNMNDKETIVKAKNNFMKKERKRENLDKFLNKFRSKKK